MKIMIQNHGSVSVVFCLDDESYDWFTNHTDAPPWTARGFAIETNYLGDVVEAFVRDQGEVI